MSVPPEILEAARTGQPIRIHTTDGEVLVARVLDYDDEKLIYAALTSSRPERYAVCDSTGFALPLATIERIRLVRAQPARRARH